MQNNEFSQRHTKRLSAIRATIIVITFALLPTTAFAGVVEEVFVKDRNLLAVTHFNNLGSTDKQAQELLQDINSQNPTANPILSLLASEILVEGIANIDANNWSEALYFSQPLEKNNNWVYIFHIISPEKYIGALLGTGKIRQELTDNDITRYRKTDGLDSEVYYLAYGKNNVAIMSKNSSAVAKAVTLYNDESISKSGILAYSDSDYTATLNLNRYFLANSRVLPNFFKMLHNDILRDLAGTTAKSDNILNLILGYLEGSIQDIVNEIAILDFRVSLSGDNITVKTNIDIQYGGSLHYALSAYEGRENSITNLLPANTIMLTEQKLWTEEYIQVLEGIGNLGVAIIGDALEAETSKKTGEILDYFQTANPLSLQQGILSPETENNSYGPVAVSVITFEDASKLPELFEMTSDLLSTGEYSEFLAEKGIKIELKSVAEGLTTANTKILETELFVRSTYFTLPDAFLTKQHILSTILGNRLITIIPLAPLSQAQYNATKDFCLKSLAATVSAISSPDITTNAKFIDIARTYSSDNTIFTLTVNPLRYIQVAMRAEAIWPEPSPPNRLPIPWREFSQFFNSKNASSLPMNLTINSNRTSVGIDIALPKAALVSFMQSLLTLTPLGGL